ncbi:hypothetical protein B0H17DRAFT_886106, partial [Mycena rosella]
LRQEFRELETLNVITELVYNGLLGRSVKGITRKDLLHTFQDSKGGNFQPDGLHDAVRWCQGDGPLRPAKSIVGKGEFVGARVVEPVEEGSDEEIDSEIEAAPIGGKRKLQKTKTRSDKGKKRARVDFVTLPGLAWDQVNHSCAYDAVLTPLYNLWQDHGPRWTDKLNEL